MQAFANRRRGRAGGKVEARDGEGALAPSPTPSSSHGGAERSEGADHGIHAGTPRQRGTAGEGRRFFTPARVPAVPAWILGSRSASLRLP